MMDLFIYMQSSTCLLVRVWNDNVDKMQVRVCASVLVTPLLSVWYRDRLNFALLCVVLNMFRHLSVKQKGAERIQVSVCVRLG